MKNGYAEEYQLTFSLEDYLKTIVLLAASHKVVRVKHIARALHCTASSVSGALERLKHLGPITHEKYEEIELTDHGREVGEQICQKFTCLVSFFQGVLLIESSSAQAMACQIEHCISPDVYHRLTRLLTFYQTEKAANNAWVARQESCLLKE